MAADWLKVRSDLYRDPRVSVMADILLSPDGELAAFVSQNCQRHMTVTRNVMRNVTVGALVSVWGVMRQRGDRDGDDLKCYRVTVRVLDDIADLPGFGDAMELSGWVVQTDEGIIFPGFFKEYNADPAYGKGSANAERQRRYRENKRSKNDVTRDVTRDVTVTPREEKRREEERDNSPVPVEAIRKAYNDALPMLPHCKKVSGEREKHLRARWNDPDRQSLEYWVEFFEYVAASDFLTGRSKSWGTWSGPDFDWLVNETNHVKVAEGKYENKGTV